MKNILLTAIMLFTATCLMAQTNDDFSGLKLFVNPGHGGHDSDDRHMLETDFWESEGNLAKGLHLRDLLENRNAEVFMSRTTNTTADDLPLSTISAMANEANVDFFLSIHSNGADGKRNRPLVLYRGYTNDPVFDDAKSFAQMLIKRLLEKGDFWTSTGEWIAGDWTFYDWGTQGLGVLRNLNMAGVLSEGSFHDYIPEGWRLRNDDYLKHEAWAFSRTFTDFFDVQPEPTGLVAGVVRNPFKSPDYYFDPMTYDISKPINSALVTLNPGGQTYRTDNLNNGYFMFDKLTPGEYELTFSEVPDFYNGVYTFEIEANKSNLVNFEMQKDQTLVPVVDVFSPDDTENVPLNQQYMVVFSTNMDEAATEAAIVTEPPLDLEFTWEDHSTILYIDPVPAYSFNLDYTLSINTTATSMWGVHLADKIEHSFLTVDHTKLDLINYYPADNSKEISPYLQLRMQFNAPLDESTIEANIELVDANSQTIDLKNKKVFTEGADGFYYFEPADGLDLGATFTLKLKENLTDDYGANLGETIDITFTTGTDEYPDGNIVENYEVISHFWDPEGSGSTTGTLNDETIFTLSTTHKMNGAASGHLQYVFVNENGGICREYNTLKPSIGSQEDAVVGVWVFGDMSMNRLEYWFYRPGNEIVAVDIIDWAGWAYKSVPMSAIGGSGDCQFHSIVVVQNENGAKKGELYFDDAQVIMPPFLDISSESLTIAAAANSTRNFSITSSVDWTIECSDSWLTVNKTSGSGNTSVKITAEANTVNEARSATVTIKGDGVPEKTITVTQSEYVSGIEDTEAFVCHVYPNPVSNRAIITLNLNAKTNITIDAFDLEGRKVDEIYRAVDISGQQTIAWFPDENIAGGIYVLSISYGNTVKNIKCAIVK